MARTETGAQLEEQESGRQADQNGEPEPEISIRGLTKTFGPQTVFDDVTCDIPKGKVTLILGPSGTGKSVFLKHIMGLLKPDKGEIWIDGKNIPDLRHRDLYAVRRKFGVLFQDGALFGSMTIYDNVAFPLREHTKKPEREIRDIVNEKLKLVGLEGAETKLPGQISGGMRKRAGLARGLVLEPEILMFDEPDSGLDPVRTAFLNELILDLNRKLGTTIIVVTHDIATARRIADYIGMLYLRKLVQFGPAKDMFESDIPAVKQFLAGQTEGPIGMSEEADRSKPVSTSGMTAEETEELERQAGAPPEGQAGAPPEGEDEQAAFAGGGEGEETTKAREEALESAKQRQEQAQKEEPQDEDEEREAPQTEDEEEGFLSGLLSRAKESDEADERFENYAQAGQSQPADSPTEEEVKIVGRRSKRRRRQKKGKGVAGDGQTQSSETSQAEPADDQATVQRRTEDEWKGDVL